MRNKWFAAATLLSLLLVLAPTALGQTIDDFNPKLALSGSPLALAIQPDGKILVGGDFQHVGGVLSSVRHYVARLNVDGTVDSTFQGSANGAVNSVLVQPDGKLLIAGRFTSLGVTNGTETVRNRIGRLNADGTVDATFNPGADSEVKALLLEPDGQIVVAGLFNNLGGGTGTTFRKFIGRLNSDGTVDSGFNPGADNPVYALALQDDGAIVVGGAFTGLGQVIGSVPRSYIGRIEASGALDGSFDPGADNEVLTLAVQADGAIVVGGKFLGLGGGSGVTSRPHIGRLSSNGIVDVNFDSSASDEVRALHIQADQRILVGGNFFGLNNDARFYLGRLNSDGGLDSTFGPGAQGAVEVFATQADGRLVVGGRFSLIGGGGFGSIERLTIARIMPTTPQQSAVTVTGGTITWLRGGSLPEASYAAFASSVDGVAFTNLGLGSRVNGGWELTGTTLPSDPNLRIRARAFAATGSGSIVEVSVPLPGANIVENGDFSVDSTGWSKFALPDASGMTWSVTGGRFEFYRTGGQAVVFQQTGLPLPPQAAVEVSFQIANTDTVRKRITVLVHDASFDDLGVCTFWLPPNAPLRTYVARTHTTEAWKNATVSFYAASTGSGGAYQLDNVSMTYLPAGSNTDTICIDPLAPAAPGGTPGANLVVNGHFPTTNLPPWTLFGQITGSITSSVFNFTRLIGSPAGALLQQTNAAITEDQLLEATFQLGSNAGRSRVTVILHENDFSDLAACTFWISPNQALSTYTMRTYATKAWTNATVSVYAATAAPTPSSRLDSVVFRRVPGAPIIGTECFEPGSTVPSAGDAPEWTRRENRGVPAVDRYQEELASGASGSAERTWSGDGFAESADGGWVASGTADAERVLEYGPIDLVSATHASLSFKSRLGSAARARVEVSVDGERWESIYVVPASDNDSPIDLDLSAYLGSTMHLRFVLAANESSPADVWAISDVRVDYNDAP